MKRPLLLAAALALAGAPARAATDGDECRAFSRQDLAVVMRHKPGEALGDALNRSGRFGDFSAVIARCDAALVAAPGDQDLQLQRARALIAQTEFASAATALQPLAQASQPTALRLYGVLFAYGLGVPGNSHTGNTLIEKAADLGDPVAPLLMGVNLRSANEPEDAYRPWFLRALQTGYPATGFVIYGEIRYDRMPDFTGKGQLQLLQDAAAKGWPEAMLMLSIILQNGDGLPRDQERAEELQRRVKALQPEAGLDWRSYWWQLG